VNACLLGNSLPRGDEAKTLEKMFLRTGRASVAEIRHMERSYTSVVQPPFTLLAYVWLIVVQAPGNPNCLRQIEEPTYPHVARAFDSEGTVNVRFSVGADGKVARAAYTSEERLTSAGNKTLTAEIQHILDRTQLDPSCQGNYTLRYRFILNEERTVDAHTTVEFIAPNDIVVKANHDLMTCSVYSIDKPSWHRRFSNWLRKRGEPMTTYTLECR